MRDRTNARRSLKGFTLVEAMVVVAILGVLVALATPSFTALIESQRAKSAAVDLYIALTRARSEAIKQNRNVTLVSKSGGNWSGGWRISDPVTNALIEDHDAITGLTINGPESVIFQSSGRVRAGSAPSLSVSGDYADSARCVSIDLSGRPTIKKGDC